MGITFLFEMKKMFYKIGCGDGCMYLLNTLKTVELSTLNYMICEFSTVCKNEALLKVNTPFFTPNLYDI